MDNIAKIEEKINTLKSKKTKNSQFKYPFIKHKITPSLNQSFQYPAQYRIRLTREQLQQVLFQV